VNIILASASAARREMLARAGIEMSVVPAAVDEAAVKAAAKAAGLSASALALRLAGMKAMRIAMRRTGALVIGADQVLDQDGTWFDKPRDPGEAAAHIRRLRGGSHELATAICCARDGRLIWHHTETPRLVMRELSDAFITDYVAREGEALLACVGAYRLEGRGIQLFDRIEGDFFTILGLPLLPLLGFLRAEGAIS
jgi:septum formation protein